VTLISECCETGSSQKNACSILGISERTLQRWILIPGQEDRRQGPTSTSAHALTEEERRRIVEISSSQEFQDKSPHQIVPKLADQGEYIASESSFYRVLKAHDLLAHRGRSKPRNAGRPRAYETTKPKQLFSWDITYLRSNIQGRYFFLYMFLDIYSRKIVGWEIHERESPEHSSRLLQNICKSEVIERDQLSIHADNGGPMKGATMLATMQKLGIMPSFSRPSVSNDNPFSEALFKTLKYCPQYPSSPFLSIETAREWVSTFVAWYNDEHLHSAISFTTPSSRHSGEDEMILHKRAEVYRKARENKPLRWSQKTRNWGKVEVVRLNWLKDEDRTATEDKRRSVS
jgi:putative transposase